MKNKRIKLSTMAASLKYYAIFSYTESTPYYWTGEVTLILVQPDSLSNPYITYKAPASVPTAKVANHYGLNYTGGAAEEISGNLVPELQGKWTTTNDLTLRFGIQLSNEYTGSDKPFPTILVNNVAPATDTSPPSIPQNLKIVLTGSTFISLEWDKPVTGFAYSYNVYYKVKGTNVYSVKNVRTNSATLTKLTPLTTYTIYVVALNASNVASNPSKSIEASTLPAADPVEPVSDVHTMFSDSTILDYDKGILGNNGIYYIYLGFVVLAPDATGTYDLYWAGIPQPSMSATTGNYLKDVMAIGKSNGYQFVVSFGGANGPVPENSTNLTMAQVLQLELNLLQNYDGYVAGFDWDIEGGAITDKNLPDNLTANVNGLRNKYPDHVFSLTLPVEGSKSLVGYAQDGINLVNGCGANDLIFNRYTLMTMEFADPVTSPEFPNSDLMAGVIASVQAANKTILNSNDFFKNLGELKTYQYICACPFFGKNNNGFVWTPEDQLNLNSVLYNKNMPIGLSGWSKNLDMFPERWGQSFTPGIYGDYLSRYVPYPVA